MVEKSGRLLQSLFNVHLSDCETVSDVWTPERIEQLRSWWTEGLSATQISRMFGNGISRNAVIGKIHRLNIQGPNTLGSGPNKKPRNTFKRSEKTVKTKPFVPRVVEKAPEACGPLNDFPERGLCRWIDAHPALQDWQCCGHPNFSEWQYCELHADLAKAKKTPAQIEQEEPAERAIGFDELAKPHPFKFNPGHKIRGAGNR